MGPGPATRVSRLRSLVAQPTFPAHRPAVQIDHVLADGQVRAVRATSCRLGISDHLALVVDLELD